MHTHSPLPVARFAHPMKNVGALGVEPGMKVADFGSGSGAYVFAIAQALEGSGHVYAIDIQRDLLRRLKNEAERRGYKNVEVICGDLEIPGASKLADQSIDLVLVSNLLFQLADHAPALQESRRIVRPGGQLAIIDWSDSFGGMGPQKKDVVTREAAKKKARDAGFDFVHEFPAGAHHYGLLFKPEKV